MATDLEQRIVTSLRREAARVEVPAAALLPAPRHGRHRGWAVALAAAAAVAVIGIVIPILGGVGNNDRPRPGGSTPTSAPATPRIDSFADLPAGEPPDMPYVRNGSLMMGDISVDVEWGIAAVVGFGSDALIWNAEEGFVHHVSRGRIQRVAANVSTPPVTSSFGHAWIEGDREIVLGSSNRIVDRQALASADQGTGNELIGIDQRARAFVSTSDGAWVWETGEGSEGGTAPPAGTVEYFKPVAGLGNGRLVAVNSGDGIVVSYPNGEFGWGWVDRGNPSMYHEVERLSAENVWAGSDPIIALTPDGRLVAYGAPFDTQSGEFAVQTLNGREATLDLPALDEVRSVHRERRGVVIVDATDATGQRAWLRCTLTSAECEVAAELSREDVTPD